MKNFFKKIWELIKNFFKKSSKDVKTDVVSDYKTFVDDINDIIGNNNESEDVNNG